MSDPFTDTSPDFSTVTSALKYFSEIFFSVPSARSSESALSDCCCRVVSVLRKVRACLPMSDPASPAILTFFDPVEAR